jgi:Tfp pilus assembly protein PilF
MAKSRRASRPTTKAARLESAKPPAKTQTARPAGDTKLWVLLFCVTLVAYWPALNGGLLWDDDSHVTRPELQSLHGLARIWTDPRAAPQYYPLLHSAFWLEHQMWGGAVLGYHLTNVALHAIAAALVVLIVKRLALPGAWLAGLIFALHPVHVEAVAWISEQKSALSAVFFLASFLAYLQFDRTRRRPHYFLAFGLFLLALLSKTVTATLPAVLLVTFWWQRGRLGWRRDVLPLVPWLALGSAAGMFTAWVERTFIGAHGPEYTLTLTQRFLLAGRVIWFYLGKLLWPANLTFSYPRWIIDSSTWWQYLFPAGVVAVAVALATVARKHRGPLAGFLIFAGTLFPALGFLNVYPFRYSYVADHFQYLASLGIIVPVSTGLSAALRRPSISGAMPVLLPSLLLGILGLLTWRQSFMYASAETLYRETLARNPSSWMAHTNLGNIMAQSPERLPDAIAEFQTAIRINPDAAEAHLSLGSALAHLPDRMPDAIAEFQTALRLKPDYAEAHFDLGNAQAHVPDRLPDAIAEYRAAVQLKPDFALTHLNLGNALSRTPGGLPEAVKEYEAALELRPDSAETHYNLGSALAQLPGRVPDAIAQFQAAVLLNPELEAARQAIEVLQTGPR